MDRLEAMTLLIAAAETGSFTAAGRKLGVSLPTVARKIGELETLLKTQLVIRSTRRITLTDAGAAYLANCRRILELVSEAETEVSGEYSEPRGELIVTAPIVFGRIHFVPTVSDFLTRYPEINVRMTLSDRNINLIEDHVDLAVRIGELPDSTLIASKLGTVRRVVCGSPEYFQTHGVPSSPDELMDLTCVTYAALSSGPPWTFPGHTKSGAAFRPRCRLNINTAESAIDAAVRGVGITHVLSYQIAGAVAAGRLQVVLQGFEPPPLPVHLLYTRQATVAIKMRSFLEYVVPRIRKALAEDDKRLGAATGVAETDPATPSAIAS